MEIWCFSTVGDGRVSGAPEMRVDRLTSGVSAQIIACSFMFFTLIKAIYSLLQILFLVTGGEMYGEDKVEMCAKGARKRFKLNFYL